VGLPISPPSVRADFQNDGLPARWWLFLRISIPQTKIVFRERAAARTLIFCYARPLKPLPADTDTDPMTAVGTESWRFVPPRARSWPSLPVAGNVAFRAPGTPQCTLHSEQIWTARTSRFMGAEETTEPNRTRGGARIGFHGRRGLGDPAIHSRDGQHEKRCPLARGRSFPPSNPIRDSSWWTIGSLKQCWL